ncbi:MAG TPA: peptide chain release factor 3 [Phycisphaerales bacterium]|nr:peptide chain release factor 3 [Phycisphaerales bacterium]
MSSAALPRRTFAIISHPDAGKTTLTEKLLLYGGAVALAGSVTARKNQRATASDWMELEKQRGISISSTVLQFDYNGVRINLLDTPGHKDFSEDTYRVLTAVDAAVMVIDAGKGIEPQTRKLFEVCRRRGVPIFTFMNKCDRPTRDPLELLDELERVLGIGAFPVNWPFGTGPTFRGVYDRLTKQVHLFERAAHGAYTAPVQALGIDDPTIKSRMDESVYNDAREQVEMLMGAGESFDRERVLAGEVTPVYFGSAMNNFGVQLLLDGFLEHSAPPGPRKAMTPEGERMIQPEEPTFSGFVFKIQANMDPRHRDRIAFVRVVSGTFTREMTVLHAQSGKRIRLSNAQKLFGQQRETVEDGRAGDVVGIVGHDVLRIGDTLSEDRNIVFNEIPRFTPECFAYLHNPQPSNSKKFRLGVDQLLQEGVVQVLMVGTGQVKTPLLAAVGPLQFEVVQYRLESEYGAESRLEHARWNIVRWYRKEGVAEDWMPEVPMDAALAVDRDDRRVALFADEWGIRNFQQRNPGVELSPLPFEEVGRGDVQINPLGGKG